MGQADYTAKAPLNGKRIYSPYMLNITSFLQPSTNALTVPGQFNSYLNKARRGESRYKQFKDRQDQVMSGRLLGSVIIRAAQ